jgi:hypothetical protein
MRPGDVRFAFVDESDFCSCCSLELPQSGFFVFFVFFVFFFNPLKCCYSSISPACLKTAMVVPFAAVNIKTPTQKMVSKERRIQKNCLSTDMSWMHSSQVL